MASYAQISLINISKTREGDSERNYEIRLQERDSAGDDLSFDLYGEINIQHGANGDDILKPVKPSQVNFQIKSRTELATKLIGAEHRQFYLTIRETESGRIHFQGYIKPDYHKYDIYEGVKTVSLQATGDLAGLVENDASNDVQTLKDVFDQVNTDLEMTRQTDFYMRTRYSGQDLSDPIPQRIWLKELEMIGQTQGKRLDTIQQICQQFELQLFQENGRLVVADVYERFKTPGAANRYAGGTTQGTENILLALDESNVLRKAGGQKNSPTGQKVRRIGRVVTQRQFLERDEQQFEFVEPGTVIGSSGPIETSVPGVIVSGDVIRIGDVSGEIVYAPDPPAVGSVDMSLEISFVSGIDGLTYYYDFANRAWGTTQAEATKNYQLLATGVTQPWSFGDFELEPIPEEQFGEIKMVISRSPAIPGDPEVDATVSLLQLFAPVTFNDRPDDLFYQWIGTNVPGDTSVYPLYTSDYDGYVGDAQTLFLGDDEFNLTTATGEWIDESDASLMPFGERSLRRKSELLLGTADRIHLILRDSTQVSLLNILAFEGVNYTPVCIKEQLLAGYLEVWMKPAPGLQFDFDEGYTFTPEDLPATSSDPSRSYINSRITDRFSETLAAGAIAKTTATISVGTVTSIEIDREGLLEEGNTITIVDSFLNRHRFKVAADQEGSTVSVEPESVVTPIEEGSYVYLATADTQSGILANKRGISLFSEGIAVGQLLSDAAGVTTSLNIELFAPITEGWALNMNLPEVDEPVQAIIDHEDDYTGQGKQSFDTGAYTALPILEQNFETTAKAGQELYVDGQQMLALLNVTPAGVLLSAQREKTGDSIGRLRADLSGTVSTIPLQDVDGIVKFKTGGKYLLINRLGQSEVVTSAQDFNLTNTNNNLPIEEIELQYEYAKDYAWLKESNSSLTGRVSVQAGEIEQVVTNQTAQGSLLASLSLLVNELEASAVLKVDAFGRIASVSLTADHDGSTIKMRADQIDFDTNRMSIADLIFLGKSLAGLKTDDKKVLIGLNDPNRPFVHVRTDNNNFVEMVARPSGDNDPFFQVMSNGEVVFKVDRNGAVDIENVTLSHVQYRQSYESPPGPTSFTNYVVTGKAALMIGPTGGTVTLSGILALETGTALPISNRGDSDLILEHQGATSNAANRIITPTGSDYTIAPNHGATLIYDGTDNRWRFLSTT